MDRSRVGRRAEAEAVDGRARLFERAFSSSDVSLVLLTLTPPSYPISFVSPGFEALTGYGAGEVLGLGLDVLDGSGTDLRQRARVVDLLRTKASGQVLIRQYRRDGTSFWANLMMAPVRDSDALATHCLCVQLDVTRQVEAEEALLTSLNLVSRAKNEWEATVDSLQEIVLLADSRMRITRANQAVERWGLGTVRSLRGRDLHSLLHPRCFEDHCYLMEQWAQCVESKSGIIDRNVLDSQLERRLQVTMQAIPGAGSDAGRVGVSLVMRDVGQSHEEQEIARRRDRFEAMGWLVGGLAHEIGNPLAAMKTTLEVWSRSFEGFDRESHARYLARLSDGVERLRATVDRILGRRDRQPDRTCASLAGVLERAQTLFEDQAKASGCTLLLSLDEDVRGAEIAADPTWIDEILANVLKNAIEASSEGDGIRISAQGDRGEVLIRVRDPGVGIRQADMRNLFVPFFTTKPTGTGIGLAHANRLLEELGGSIDVESREGRGSMVTLRLPRVARADPV